MKTNLLNFKALVVLLALFISSGTCAAFTAVTSGNWSSAATWGGVAPTGTVLNQDIIIPSGITVTLDADVTFIGLLNAFTVNGVLTNTTVNSITMSQGAFAGSGTISVNKIMFMATSTSSFSGTLNLKQLVNNSTSLGFAAIANITDTLYLESGNLLLNTNGNLTMASNSTVKVNSGILSSGAGVFNSGSAYNVMYVGSSKTAGIELNTVTLQNLYLNMSSNTQSVTLFNNTIINGSTTVNSGKLSLNGKKLTLRGDLLLASGSSIMSTASSDLLVEGTGSLTSSLMFDNASSINDLTINKASGGQVKIGSALNVTGHLNLMDGNFSIENGAMITMVTSSTVHVEKGNLSLNTGTFVGTAAYNVEYMGSSNSGSGAELSGTGLNNVMIGYATNSNKVTLNNNLVVAGRLDMNKGMLDLNGKNLSLNGTISQNANSAFIGNTASELNLNLTSVTNDSLFFDASGSNSQTLSKLRINTTGTTAIVVATKLLIGSELSFVKGKIEIANGDLVILPAASVTGYDATKYIVTSGTFSGSLVMNVTAGSSFVTFPIGLMSDYSPAYVQQATSATSGNFTAKAVAMTSTSLKTVNRTWLVESSVTTINANLKFGWVTAAEMNGFDRSNAYVSHYTSSAWDVTVAASATSAANGTYELTRTGITSLSPFAVVQQGEPLKIKENSAAREITLFPNPSKDVVNIRLADSSENYKFELTDLTGRIVLVSDDNTIDVSGLETGCYFIKATSLNDNQVITKRFVKN